MIPQINFATLHFLRPEWCYALIPLLLLAALLVRRKLFTRNWHSIIDPRLMPHVLIGKAGKQGYWSLALLLIAGILAIVAQAGPVWEQLPQPVFKQQSAMVVALDLSSSMNAEDIKPSRLQRAQFKLRDLLALRKEGQTALIVYANGAFTVTPLTDDTNTIAAMIPSLTTDMLPAQGNNTTAAVSKAIELMKNGGVNNGDILLLTDDINGSTAIFADALHQGYRVSILGIGTASGAPIAQSKGDFVKDQHGGIVISKLDAAQLAEAAQQGGGRYSSLSTDDRDITYLLGAADLNRLHANNKLTAMKTDTWQEQGPWLLLLVIPLAAFAFRKGYVAVLLLFILPLPQPAHALSWDALWRNDNQRAAETMQNNNPQTAAQLFNDPQWQAAANYRAGNFQQAADALQNINTSDAQYNRGNALARLGATDQAISAYDEALKLNPNNADARFNKELLEKQKQQNNSDQNKSTDSKKDKSDQQQSGQPQAGQDKTGDKSPGADSQSAAKPSDANQAKQNQSAKDSAGKQSNDNSSASNAKAEQKNNATPDNKQQSAQADAAKPDANQQQRQAAQQANADQDSNSPAAQQAQAAADHKADLSKQASEQWLRKIPDDPGGLLRRKFKHQYQQQSNTAQGDDSW